MRTAPVEAPPGGGLVVGTGRQHGGDEPALPRHARPGADDRAHADHADHPGQTREADTVDRADRRAALEAEREHDFESYMRARQPSLLRTAYLLTGDRQAAEDLVQTALARLYLSWSRVRDREALDGYVRRILVNEHRSTWRRAWRRLERSTAVVPEPAPHTDTYDEGTGAVLWTAVRSLPPKQRAVVVLRYYEGLSEREIADLLGVAPGTVKSQASRALATLRERAPEALREAPDHPAPDRADTHAAADDPTRGREEDR